MPLPKSRTLVDLVSLRVLYSPTNWLNQITSLIPGPGGLGGHMYPCMCREVALVIMQKICFL